jgi:gliding motility-associated-like protein
MKRILSLLFVLPLLLQSQHLKYYYDFNQCKLSEKQPLIADIITANPPVCSCGLEQECIELNNQALTLPLSIDTIFHDDFSLGFAISIPPSNGNLDILSKARTCNNDTSMSIIYQAKDSLFVCYFQQGFDKIVQLSGKADPQKCWQQLMITKLGGQFRLYINGEIVDEDTRNFVVRLNSKIPIVFNQSPCLINRINAKLDQIIIADYAMKSSEVLAEYLLQDEIITQDTLIFLGGSFDLRAKSDCAVKVQWSPVQSLSDATILNPTVTPLKQTKYYLTVTQGFCKALDSILIKVIDTSMIDCSALKLPTAFTPNDDQLNDRFFISNNYIIEKLSYFDIMDRNGGLIVRYNDPKASWDGSWNGTLLTPGTFYYRIAYTCKDKEYKTKGSFFLMR